jgi:trimeric autotransporter adhesin
MKRCNNLSKKVSSKRVFLIAFALFAAFSLKAQLTVTPAGNVGIGTSSPAAKLDVAGNMRLTNEIRFTNGNAMKGLVWGFSDFSSYTSRIDDYNGQLGIYTDDHFYLGGINTTTGVPGDVKFYINTVTGNTGIGTTAPSEKLDVAGNIRLNDNRLYLRGAGDNSHGIGFDYSIDGPVIFGNSGGALGSTAFGNKNILIWNHKGEIGIGTTPIADIQLALTDKYAAGGKNLLVGDDAYLSDVDVVNVLGIYGNSNSTVGGIKLGSGGPVLWGQNGALGIGDAGLTMPTGYKLIVEQGILTEKVKVAIKTSADWADHVFADNYQLMPLEQVAGYIDRHKHLPGLPSAEKLVAEGGIDVNQMFAKQMEKIEELTLHVIALNRKVAKLDTEKQQLQQTILSHKK